MISDADEHNRSRLYVFVVVAAGLLLTLIVVWWPGCRHYPIVTSSKSLELLKRLYVACNTRDAALLAKVAADIETLSGEGKLSAAEYDVFQTIIRDAQAGNWEKAERAALQFAQDQVGRGFPSTNIKPMSGSKTFQKQ